LVINLPAILPPNFKEKFMYNTDLPTQTDLPSGKQLLRSTLLAILIAAVLLVTVVLPSEYGIDPTGIGNALGLTQMGRIKMAQAADAKKDSTAAASVPTQAESASVQAPAVGKQNAALPPVQTAADTKPASNTDETTVTLKPGEGVEVKMEMSKGAKARYEWTTAGGAVNHDTHVDKPDGGAHSYSKGQQVERDSGEITAVFDGYHGWFWRNRNSNEVTITLKTTGEYRSIKRM
jgi:hypothetical protein